MIAMALALAAGTAGCTLPDGWAAIEARRPRYVVFGELHGTVQSPEFVGRVACALAAREDRVLVAVELDAESDTVLQTLWHSPGEGFAERVIATLSFFAGRDDGVASRAMLAMLTRLHDLRLAGAAIDVVAFNGRRSEAQAAKFAKLPGQGPHEAEQAENIALAAGSRRYDHVLVLVGNLHAKRTPVERGGVSFEPMAMRLARTAPLISLVMNNDAGTAWSCQLKDGIEFVPGKPLPDSALQCANHPMSASTTATGAPRMGLGVMPGSTFPVGTFDGYYWLGPVEGSPPAGEKGKP